MRILGYVDVDLQPPVPRDPSRFRVDSGSSTGTERRTPRSFAQSRPGPAASGPCFWIPYLSIIILIAGVLFLAYRIGLRNGLNFTIQ